jgi:type IV pilus assembly protein PilE
MLDTVQRNRGFTLLEVMITVAIVGILAAIALPSYNDYVTRSKILDATSKLGDLRSQMEKYFMDNRTYLSNGVCAVADGATAPMNKYNNDPSSTFQVSCPGPTATTYSLQAVGMASKGMSGFEYRINQANDKVTQGLPPSGWSGSGNPCWVTRKDGTC